MCISLEGVTLSNDPSLAQLREFITGNNSEQGGGQKRGEQVSVKMQRYVDPVWYYSLELPVSLPCKSLVLDGGWPF